MLYRLIQLLYKYRQFILISNKLHNVQIFRRSFNNLLLLIKKNRPKSFWCVSIQTRLLSLLITIYKYQLWLVGSVSISVWWLGFKVFLLYFSDEPPKRILTSFVSEDPQTSMLADLRRRKRNILYTLSLSKALQ